MNDKALYFARFSVLWPRDITHISVSERGSSSYFVGSIVRKKIFDEFPGVEDPVTFSSSLEGVGAKRASLS